MIVVGMFVLGFVGGGGVAFSAAVMLGRGEPVRSAVAGTFVGLAYTALLVWLAAP